MDLKHELEYFLYKDAINSFEAKEVDIEKEFRSFLDDIEGMPRMWHSDEQLEWGLGIAKHFFALGLKANNPITTEDKGTAGELAKQLYPDWESTSNPKLDGQEQSIVRMQRQAFLKGYHQAKKALALTIEDIEKIHTFLSAVKHNKQGVFTFTRLSDEQYQEVLRRFSEIKVANN